MQDPTVVDRLKRSDGGALKSLFKTNAEKSYLLALRLTGDEETARQVVHAVFSAIWEDRGSLDSLVPISGILLRNTFLKSKEREGKATAYPLLPDDADPRLDALSHAIRALPDGPRLVFLLMAVDGFTQRDVARALDVNEEDVISLYGRALEGLEEVVQTGVF